MWQFFRSLMSAVREARQQSGTSSGRRKRIWFMGPMPPPLHGQSNYNKTILTFFREHAPVTVLPTGGTGAEKIVASIVLPFIILFRIPNGDHVYTSPPGQNGLWLFMASIAALRLRKLDHFVHHHSFRPINLGPTRSARVLTSLGGAYQRHVFLSERMRDRYANLYLSTEQKRRSFVLPNAYFFFEEKEEVPVRTGPVTLGHLSVITREKGIDYLMALVEKLLEQRNDFRFVMAGPVRDPVLEAEVKAFCEKHPRTAFYLGPVFDTAKTDFYRNLDVFVLPSRLVDEADPLVILEAFGFGCEIVASSTGCIPERIRSADRLMTFDMNEDVARLDKTISEIQNDRSGISAACRAHVRLMHIEAENYAQQFFEAFSISLSSGSRTPRVTDGIPPDQVGRSILGGTAP